MVNQTKKNKIHLGEYLVHASDKLSKNIIRSCAKHENISYTISESKHQKCQFNFCCKPKQWERLFNHISKYCDVIPPVPCTSRIKRKLQRRNGGNTKFQSIEKQGIRRNKVKGKY